MTGKVKIHFVLNRLIQGCWLVIHDNDRFCHVHILKQFMQGFFPAATKSSLIMILPADNVDSIHYPCHTITQYSDPMPGKKRNCLFYTADVFMVSGNGIDTVTGFDVFQSFPNILMQNRPQILIHNIPGK